MPCYSDIRTRALREILAESSFSDPAARERVENLLRLEGMLHTPPWGMAANMSCRELRSSYPVETLRFASELNDGVYLGVAEAEARHEAVLAAEDTEARLAALGLERKMAEADAAARSAWLAAGGLP
jgi:hypothetical protein